MPRRFLAGSGARGSDDEIGRARTTISHSVLKDSAKIWSVEEMTPLTKRPDTFAFAVLTVVTLACLLPFLGKAFHIDDPLFIWCGRHIVSDPWNFYDFKVNWFGKEEAMSTAMQNPPLASYYL